MNISSLVLEPTAEVTAVKEDIEAALGIELGKGSDPRTWTTVVDDVRIWLSETLGGEARIELSSVGPKFRIGDVWVIFFRLIQKSPVFTP